MAKIFLLGLRLVMRL